MDRLDRIRDIRARLAAGAPAVGCWLQIPSADVAEILGSAGFVWVAVDSEHGAIGVSDYPGIFRAIDLGGSLPLVRVAEATTIECRRALDAGAGGVIVPRVESPEQAIALSAACRWPPDGTRGVGFSRANRYGADFDAYKEEAARPLFVCMIESGAGLENVEAIAAAGVADALFVGPYDLSASLGATGELRSPAMAAALKRIRAAAGRSALPLGIHSVSADPAEVQAAFADGFQFVAFSTDALVLSTAFCSAARTAMGGDGKGGRS